MTISTISDRGGEKNSPPEARPKTQPRIATTPTSSPRPPDEVKDVSDINSTQAEIKLAQIEEVPCCPSWSPDGQKIAFAIFYGYDKGIYVINRDGTDLKQVVRLRRAEGNSPPIMPTWSKDGQAILYREGDTLFMVSAAGDTDPQPYAGANESVPAPNWIVNNRQLSPDGAWIAIIKSQETRDNIGLYIKPVADQVPIFNRGGYCCPRWSPDDKKIAFAILWGMYKGIYILNRDGSGLKRLVYIRRGEGDSPPIMPTWSKDGQAILYRNRGAVFIVPADGSRDPQPYDQPDPPVPQPAWPVDYQAPSPDTQYYSQVSADGRYLAIIQGGLYIKPVKAETDIDQAAELSLPPSTPPPPTSAISRPPSDEADPSTLKIAEVNEDICCPKWSPDSQKIAFVLGAGSIKGIYVVDRNASNLNSLVYYYGGDQDSPPLEFTWSADGQSLLYRGDNGVFSVAADGSSAPNAQAETALPRRSYYWLIHNQQLSPDHQYLAMVKDGGIYIRLFNDEFPLLEAEQIPCCPKWSPDGQKIAFSTLGGGIYLINRDGSGLRLIVSGGSNGPYLIPAWAEDSQSILYQLGDEVRQHPLDDNLPGLFHDPESLSFPAPDWTVNDHQLSPDKQYLAIAKSNVLGENGLYLRRNSLSSMATERPSLPAIREPARLTPSNDGAITISVADSKWLTYTDPELNFSLSYPDVWTLTVVQGTNLSANTVSSPRRTILLEREQYRLTLKADYSSKATFRGCWGLIHHTTPLDVYVPFQVDGVNVWRPSLEMGHSNNHYSDRKTTLADIHAYTLDDEASGKEYIGESSCFVEIADKAFAVHYRLPVSLEAIQAGQYRPDILAEMDSILQSIIWRTQ